MLRQPLVYVFEPEQITQPWVRQQGKRLRKRHSPDTRQR